MLYKYDTYKVSGYNWGSVPSILDHGGLACPSDYRPLSIWAKAQFEVGRGQLLSGIPIPNSNADFVDGRPLPKPLKGVVGKYRKRGGTSAREFKQRSAAGHIVLNPIEQMDLTYETHPVAKGVGAWSYHYLESPYVEKARGDLAEKNPCNGYTEPGYIKVKTMNLVSCDGVRLPPGMTSGPMHRRYRKYADYYFYEPTIEDVSLIWSSVSGVLERPWNTGLITAVSAEANQGVIDLYTTIAESKETFSWILNLLKEAITQYRKVRRSVLRLSRKPTTNAHEAANIQNEINARWLEYRYAVMPLAYSIDDALTYMQTFYTPYQSFRQGEAFMDDLEAGDWTISGLEVIDRVFLKHRYSHDAWNHQLGTSAAVTAWELVPLSFVVDWFLNIGDLLASLSVPAAVAEQNASYSRQIRLENKIVATHKEHGARITLTGGYYKAVPFDPLLRVGVVAGFNMDWRRWLDAFALSWKSIRKLAF